MRLYAWLTQRSAHVRVAVLECAGLCRLLDAVKVNLFRLVQATLTSRSRATPTPEVELKTQDSGTTPGRNRASCHWEGISPATNAALQAAPRRVTGGRVRLRGVAAERRPSTAA